MKVKKFFSKVVIIKMLFLRGLSDFPDTRRSPS